MCKGQVQTKTVLSSSLNETYDLGYFFLMESYLLCAARTQKDVNVVTTTQILTFTELQTSCIYNS